MPKLPSLAVLNCESCGAHLQTDARMGQHILPWKRKLPIASDGSCSACEGKLWTVVAVFSEQSLDVGASGVGIGLASVTGDGFLQHSTDSNQAQYVNVPAAVVARFNDAPELRMRRISEFVSIKARDELRNKGGTNCKSCGVLFVPSQEKSWCKRGYCSKACGVEAEGASALECDPLQPRDKKSRQGNLSVTCPSGHSFEVGVSFDGLPRPCPQCGTTTLVSSGQH